MKIENVRHAREVCNKIIGKLVQGNLGYFSVTVTDVSGYSQAFFTPTSQYEPGKRMIMVQDYEKILWLLMTHPKVDRIEYDEAGNYVFAVFDNPLKEEVAALEQEDYEAINEA